MSSVMGKFKMYNLKKKYTLEKFVYFLGALTNLCLYAVNV